MTHPPGTHVDHLDKNIPHPVRPHPLLDRYEREYVVFHQLSIGERKQRRRILLKFYDQLQEEGRELESMMGADLQIYGGRRLEIGRHINTVRAEMCRIRWFASWLYGVGLLSAEQLLQLRAVRNPRGSTSQAVPRPYSREDLDRFYATVEARWPKLPQRVERNDGKLHLVTPSIERWLVTGYGWRQVWRHANALQIEATTSLALHCGLRVGEIFALEINQMHHDLDYLVVKGKRKDHRERLREVPFTPPARAAVRAWLEFRGLLALGHASPWLRLRPQHAYVAWPMQNARELGRYMVVRVGSEWKFHRFRHTAATERLRAGTEIEIISEWLGHSNIQVTLGYLQFVKTDIARAMARTEAEFVRRIGRREPPQAA